MRIERLPITDLNPAPYNPRMTLKPGDRGWQALERSLAEFDLVQPIVWNESTGNVVAGHQRLAVLRHRGESDIDCVVVTLSLEREKALNITLNNASVGGDWDPDKLIDLVGELQALPDFDATLTGFDEQQLTDLLLAPAPDFGSREAASGAADGEDAQLVRVTLEIPPDAWESTGEILDDLMADHPQVVMHVRMPD